MELEQAARMVWERMGKSQEELQIIADIWEAGMDYYWNSWSYFGVVWEWAKSQPWFKPFIIRHWMLPPDMNWYPNTDLIGPNFIIELAEFLEVSHEP